MEFLSVRLSVTHWYCIKTTRPTATTLLPNDSLGCLVFPYQVWSRSLQGNYLNARVYETVVILRQDATISESDSARKLKFGKQVNMGSTRVECKKCLLSGVCWGMSKVDLPYNCGLLLHSVINIWHQIFYFLCLVVNAPCDQFLCTWLELIFTIFMFVQYSSNIMGAIMFFEIQKFYHDNNVTFFGKSLLHEHFAMFFFQLFRVLYYQFLYSLINLWHELSFSVSQYW